MVNNERIDISSLIVILNKLKLYKENEDKIIKDISNTISLLEEDYVSSNNSIINMDKEVIEVLNSFTNNIDKYIAYIEKIIINYNEFDDNERNRYNDLDII